MLSVSTDKDRGEENADEWTSGGASPEIQVAVLQPRSCRDMSSANLSTISGPRFTIGRFLCQDWTEVGMKGYEGSNRSVCNEGTDPGG